MRAIKFRAWSTKEQSWYGGFCLHKSGMFASMWNLQHSAPTWYTDKEMSGEGVVVMQFTGLQDKNGQDIYEGDLVRVKKPNAYLDGVYAVVWPEQHCQYAWGFIDARRGDIAMMGANRPYSLNQKDKEVVGNIYEKEA